MAASERWTIYVCPGCGAGPFDRDPAEEHAVEDCDPATWPWTPIEVVPAAEVERLQKMEPVDAIELVEHALYEALKNGLDQSEAVICCDCRKFGVPSCDRDGHGLVTLGDLIDFHENP